MVSTELLIAGVTEDTEDRRESASSLVCGCLVITQNMCKSLAGLLREKTFCFEV